MPSDASSTSLFLVMSQCQATVYGHIYAHHRGVAVKQFGEERKEGFGGGRDQDVVSAQVVG